MNASDLPHVGWYFLGVILGTSSFSLLLIIMSAKAWVLGEPKFLTGVWRIDKPLPAPIIYAEVYMIDLSCRQDDVFPYREGLPSHVLQGLSHTTCD